MRHIMFAHKPEFETAILIKESAFYQDQIERHYVNPLVEAGYAKENILAFSLEYESNGKAPAKFCKDYLAKILPQLKKMGVKYIYCADSTYFKCLVKNAKIDAMIGYGTPCSIPGYEDIEILVGINYQALLYNPNQADKLEMSVQALAGKVTNSYKALGADILKWALYPQTEKEIDEAFAKLMSYPKLTCDIETFSLDIFTAGIGTIAFSPDNTGGIAFTCDLAVSEGENYRWFNEGFRIKLRKFLEEYKGNLKFHRANFDTKVLIYNLWMKDPLDNEGLLRGLDCLYRDCDDTRIIAYLALNNTAKNELSLKQLAHEFAGNWAMSDITNILVIPLPELLRYNIIDTMSTWYVYNKYYPVMVRDMQLELYKYLMMPSQKTITQIELTGMPMIPAMVNKAEKQLQELHDRSLETLYAHPLVQKAEMLIQTRAMEAKNATLKTKQYPLSAFSHLKFNPNSGNHLITLLYEVMKLPVLDRTKTKQPSTAGATLKKLENHATESGKVVLKTLREFGDGEKILTSFIPTFKNAFNKGNGRSYLHGNFNLGGTVSGRLSSSDPNLQQLPSGSTFGKLIKKCFAAPDGWVFGGADFNALEDRINALLTQDPNKVKVFTDGFDGHSLRAVGYWGAKLMPDIDINDPASVNQIAEKDHPYYPIRNRSKSPSFALQYQGTWITLVKNCGFSEEEAKETEASFHALYAVSGQWVKDRIKQACNDGYATGAFGLRIRTPLLARSILDTTKTLREAEAEGRTLGNAISGQSYGLLTNRAANEFMERVWASEFRYDILPVALIHDAIYVLMRNNVRVIKFVNDNLIECMAWKGLPEIADPRIPLPAELDLYYPNWANAITLPNNLAEDDIKPFVAKALDKIKQKEASHA